MSLAPRRFRARQWESLPALSWLYALDFEANTSLLHHGRSVAVDARGFFEGAWAGAFSEFSFAECPEVFGSGARFYDDHVTLVPPSHTLEAIYVHQTSGRVVVSNSLSFLLARTEDDLQVDEWSYGRLFCSIVDGLTTPLRTIPTQRGIVTLLYHHNLILNADASIAVEPKALPAPFTTFDSYHEYLSNTMRLVLENASDLQRRSQYRGVSTASSGYDSAACAALAKELGCQEAISLRTGRERDADSGIGVARALELPLQEFERLEGADTDSDALAEFLATGMQAEDYVFRVFEEALHACVLFTGFHGDKQWERTIAPNDVIRRGDVSGSSLGEYRLRVDFIHLPVPFIGCRRHADVWRISNSEEMRPFSVGESYDRPVPRRIAEQMGVPRREFGQLKKAASLLFFWDESLLPGSIQEELERFRRQEKPSLMSRIEYAWRAAHWTLVRRIILLRSARNRGRRDSNREAPNKSRQSLFARAFGVEFSVFEHSHPRNTVWTRWAVSRIKKRYSIDANGP